MRSFKSWKSFKRHNREKHGEDGKYKCSTCNYKTNRIETLRRHNENRHLSKIIVTRVLSDILEIAISGKPESFVVNLVNDASETAADDSDELCGVIATDHEMHSEDENSINGLPALSEYERIRNRIIAERDAELRKLYPSFEQDVRALSSIPKKKRKSKKNAVPAPASRRSSRLSKYTMSPELVSPDNVEVEAEQVTEINEDDNIGDSSSKDSVCLDSIQEAESALTQSENKKFVCIPCSKPFRDSFNLKCHVRDVHMPRETAMACPRTWCTSAFHVLAELNTHKKNCLKTCHICGNSYQRIDKYKSHMRSHIRKAERMI